jgi:hypothetical protein
MSTYRGVVTLLAYATILLGIVMLVVTARHGGGVGLLLGALFVAAGLGRLWMLKRSHG